eukprot:6479485-Amphidinium_carterae.1
MASQERDMLKLESIYTMREMGEVWKNLNLRAAQEISEQNSYLKKTKLELSLNQARVDATGVTASAQFAVGQVRAEA